MEIPSMEQKTDKIFVVFKIIAFEYWTRNSHNPEEDTCNGKSMC